ncbi:exonuclease domain-containing protein [Streptomyces sp. NPDC055036]
MSYLRSRRIGWDTETTGVDPTEARIVTAAIIGRGGQSDQRVQTWLINPGVPIPPETTEVHGVDDARAQAEGQDPKAALEEIADTLARALSYGMPVVAFNQAFDWSILHYELLRHGLPTVHDRLNGSTPYTLVDPLVLDKQADTYRKGSRKLRAVAEVYGVELENWHTADADALAALDIADALFERNPRLASYDPQRLYLAQQAWREKQCAGLQEYFRRTDPTAVVEGAWPLIPRQRGGDA